MPKPNKIQLEQIEEIKEIVLEVMSTMELWEDQQLTELSKISIGVLRKNATQRHGVTRWKKGVRVPKYPSEVDVIDLHPQLLIEDWKPYAAWVLHHEYVHALGYLAHDKLFKTLENMWPSQKSKSMGKDFTEFLRRKNANWILKCEDCGKEYPRQKPGKKKYMCRSCKTILLDIRI